MTEYKDRIEKFQAANGNTMTVKDGAAFDDRVFEEPMMPVWEAIGSAAPPTHDSGLGDQNKIVITEGTGAHKGGKHVKGRALDIRTHNIGSQDKRQYERDLIEQLGRDYWIKLESPGTKDEHIHIQYGHKHEKSARGWARQFGVDTSDMKWDDKNKVLVDDSNFMVAGGGISAGTMGDAGPLPGWNGRFPTKHPSVRNSDGSGSNVKLAHMPVGQFWYVIPTMIEGIQYNSEDEALSEIQKRGFTIDQFPKFNSEPEAGTWARAHHAEFGADGVWTPSKK